MAGLICSKSPEELEQVLTNLQLICPVLTIKEVSRKLLRLLTHGRLFDIKVIEDCAKQNIGDITFKVGMY